MDLKKLHIFRYSLVLLILLSCMGIVSAVTYTVGNGSGDSFTTISAAVSNASSGDTIHVNDGNYNETITVSKELRISSVNGSSSTLVQSSGNTVFTITASNVTIEGFNITGASNYPQAGIKLTSSAANCNITDNQLNENNYGIYLDSSSDNTLTNNMLNSNYQGIYLGSSSNNNTLTSNNASENSYGIYLDGSSNNNTLTSNNASENSYGISLHSANNTLTSNNASENCFGICLYFASNNTLTNNLMSSNSYNFAISGSDLENYLHTINESNLVDGKPLYYWVNRSDAEIPANAGLVCVINSTNITVKELELTKGESGVLFAYTNNSTIQNVNASDNYCGVCLISSNYIDLDNITTSNNTQYGIYLVSSNNNILNGNIASSNTEFGIYLASSSNNTLTSNSVSDSSGGILLASSGNNTLTSNNASDNERYGIYLGSSSDNILNNNTANNNVDSSISYDSVSLDGAVSPNAVRSTTSYGIYISSSNNVTLTGDHAIGNGNYDFYASSSGGIIVDGLTLNDNSAQVSFVTDTYITGITGDDTNSHDLTDKTNVNGYVNIAHNGDMNFTFLYDDSGMSSSSESSVDLYRLNGSEWVEVPNTLLNTSANYVSANISYFGVAPLDISLEDYISTFGLFKDFESSSSSSSSSGSVATRVRSQGTITDMLTNEDGEVIADTVAKSSDSKTTLTLYKGTVGTDPSGNPVTKIIVTKPASLPADTPEEVIESGLYYDFGPSGTTFSKEVLITIDFDPEEFEGRVPTIYTYTSEGGWEALETTVDWKNGKATAIIRHFSMYALFGTDAEEVEDTVVETPVVDAGSSAAVDEESPAENDGNSGYLYLIAGFGIALVLGIVVIRKQKNDGGL